MGSGVLLWRSRIFSRCSYEMVLIGERGYRASKQGGG